jgi:uncharacterized membrane protein YcgQ (UPF0703/DUF1980 family)
MPHSQLPRHVSKKDINHFHCLYPVKDYKLKGRATTKVFVGSLTLSTATPALLFPTDTVEESGFKIKHQIFPKLITSSKQPQAIHIKIYNPDRTSHRLSTNTPLAKICLLGGERFSCERCTTPKTLDFGIAAQISKHLNKAR